MFHEAADPVIVVNRALDRDPRFYTDPETVDFDPASEGSMTFGAGPHLAQLGLKTVHEHIHRRIPTYRLKSGHIVTSRGGNVAGVDALPSSGADAGHQVPISALGSADRSGGRLGGRPTRVSMIWIKGLAGSAP